MIVSLPLLPLADELLSLPVSMIMSLPPGPVAVSATTIEPGSSIVTSPEPPSTVVFGEP